MTSTLIDCLSGMFSLPGVGSLCDGETSFPCKCQEDYQKEELSEVAPSEEEIDNSPSQKETLVCYLRLPKRL